MAKERKSGFELLRLFSIYGIVCMHTFGSIQQELAGANEIVFILVNSIFDTGVTCFILLSGYFGVKPNLRKMVKLALMVFFYSVCSLGCQLLTGESVGLEEMVKSFVPVLSRKYWFISCYFWLLMLAPFLNRAAEKMDKKYFEKLLGVLLLLFSVVPTFLYFEIMQDSGRGMAHMILVYLLGRYIGIYVKETCDNSRLWVVLGSSVALTFGINSVLTIGSGRYFAPFTRNCSLTIIVSAVALLLLFSKIKLQSKVINRLAGNVLAVYVFERAVRGMIHAFADAKYSVQLSDYAKSGWLLGIVLAQALLVVVICLLVEMVRKTVFAKPEAWLAGYLEQKFPVWEKWILRKCRREDAA